MNATSFRFFTARMEIWFPLSGILPLTKQSVLLIASKIAVMSSTEKLARVHGESISWSSFIFIATV